MPDALIVSACRTPVGSAFKGTSGIGSATVVEIFGSRPSGGERAS